VGSSSSFDHRPPRSLNAGEAAKPIGANRLRFIPERFF
jgi:hypothetical protein